MKLKVKLIIGAVVVLIVAIAIIIITRKTKKTSVDNVTVDSSKTTITENQANLKAEALLVAMNKFGTDEQAIIDNLTGLNHNDLLLVIKKFGVKPYDGGVLATSFISKIFAYDKDLAGWLRAELSGNILQTVKTMFETNNVPF